MRFQNILRIAEIYLQERLLNTQVFLYFLWLYIWEIQYNLLKFIVSQGPPQEKKQIKYLPLLKYCFSSPIVSFFH